MCEQKKIWLHKFVFLTHFCYNLRSTTKTLITLKLRQKRSPQRAEKKTLALSPPISFTVLVRLRPLVSAGYWPRRCDGGVAGREFFALWYCGSFVDEDVGLSRRWESMSFVSLGIKGERGAGHLCFGWLAGLYALRRGLTIILSLASLIEASSSDGRTCGFGRLDLFDDQDLVCWWRVFGYGLWLASWFDRPRLVLGILQPQVGGKCFGTVVTAKTVVFDLLQYSI